MSTSKLIAHRGLSARFPENTHLAFDQAWAADCAGIELDIQVSKDLQVLVIHDPDTNRVVTTENNNQIIAKSDWVDSQHLSMAENQRIPLLVDVLAKVPSGKIVQIELKHQFDNHDSLGAVIKLLATISDDIFVQIISFDVHKLTAVKQALPHLCCLYLLPEDLIKTDDSDAISLEANIDNFCKIAKQHQFDGVGLNHQFLNDEVVKLIKTHQLLIDAWTVNEPKTAQQLITMGIDFIASDIADEIKDKIIESNRY